ncbi:hypothetical protein DX027_26955 [Escherichia coli]|nr:hypothetical protein [Escherichia coli]
MWLTCRETGHGSRKIFINSENPRGRRPVTARIAGKDPRNDNGYHFQCSPVSSTIAPDRRL